MKTIYTYLATAFLIAAGLFTANRAATQTSGPLFNEIARLDSLQFAAFNARQLDQLMNYFDPSLELYQDNTGVRNFDETKKAFGGVFKMGYVLTRKLIAGTMEVYPIKDYGAIETGQHTFSHIENGKLQTGTFKFMQIWQKKNGVWRVTREVTYGH
ncbi:nuclear transport factor 2 family protein [uncultured Mucilaginibacter sp.]|uniref:nuclear transport factor 2 family protein n=1 Tax=uncultured Mucilaginibacter sp. TaxID=797541 RepID=UPI0025DD6C89|nr:nuclear transport factor 2 family protein [uncultured Mucilaginibacter sp.]